MLLCKVSYQKWKKIKVLRIPELHPLQLESHPKFFIIWIKKSGMFWIVGGDQFLDLIIHFSMRVIVLFCRIEMGVLCSGRILRGEVFLGGEDDRIIYETKNNFYEVRYIGIDLEKLLDNGVNLPFSFSEFEKPSEEIVGRNTSLFGAIQGAK